MWMFIGHALAGDLQFSPDRPGVGESTATPGQGHLMIEGGLGGVHPGPVLLGSVMGRYGVTDQIEARLWGPTLVASEGELVIDSAVGVGAKVAVGLAESTGMSFVPEVFFGGDALAFGIGVNLSHTIDNIGLWAHARPALAGEDFSALVGGGVSAGLGPIAPYVNAGAGYETTPFIGGGAAVSLGPAAQVDVGWDAYLGDGTAHLIQVGVSVGL